MPKFLNPITITTPGASAPLIVNSSTLVSNLNSDLLDGQHGSFYQNAGNLNAGTLLAARLPAFTGGDVTSTAGTVALTLANSGVTAGTYRSVTVDAKGRVTAGTNPTTLAGYAITDAMKIGGAPGVDLNTLTTAGVYRINNTEANRPNDWGQLLVMYGGSDTITQIYGHYVDGTLKTRSGNPSNVGGTGSWSPWRTLLSDHNYSSYALPLTGGTLTGSLTGTSASFGGLVTIDNSTPADILRLKSGGSTVWKVGVYDASGSYLNITADFGSILINKSNGDISGVGGIVASRQVQITATTDPAILLSGGASADGTTHLYTSIGGVGKVRIQRNGIIAGLGLSIKSGADVNGATEVFSVSNAGAVTGASFNGPGTGLTGTAAGLNIGGNAATSTNGFTVKPGWAGNQNLIAALSNFNNSVPSGFYEGYNATNSPSATWYNLINVRHSNTGNDHGFQLAMSYYDETLWSRTYSGGTGANNGTFTTWRAHLHSGNFSTYALPLSGGTLTGALVGLAATFSGATNLSGGLTVSSSTYNVFNKPTTNNYQTVSLFGSTSGGLFLTTDSPIISTGAYYNNGWITTATSGTWMNFAGGGFDWSTFSGATIGTAPTWVSRMTMSAAGVLNVPGSITQAGNQVVHAGNVSTYALPIGGGTLAGNLTINGHLTMGSGYQHRASDGSAAAPGYSFNADTDTGIHRSADNTLALVTGGAIRATVNSSGNLGVNVASALYRLQTDTAALFNRTAFGVLDINSGGSPNFIKIQTAIPFSYGTQAYTVNIRGFAYDGAQTVDITVCWHQYADTFYNPTVSSSGSFAPTVRLARENSNVVICLTWGAKYWPKLYVESVHNYDLQAYSTGWSWSDADITGDKIVTLSYKNDWGGGMSKDSSGNLTVTGNITANGIILNRERNQNARLYSATTGAMGLLGVDSAAAFRWQIYGESGNYGFLDSTWGNWDIKKGVNDQLDIRVSGSLVRVLNAGNYQNYALPLTGGTITGTLLVAPGNIAVNSLSDGYIGIGDPSHTVGWGVAQGIAGRTGDCVWAFGSNGSTGNNDTWYFGIGSAANTTFGTAFSITQNRKANFQNGVDVVSGALTQGGNQVLHAGNYSSYAQPIGTNLPYSWSNTADVKVFTGAYSYNTGVAKYLLLWQRTSGATGTNGRFVDGMLKVWRGANHAGNGGTVGYVHASSGYSGTSSEVLIYTPFNGQALSFFSVIYNSVEWVAISLPISDYRWELRGHYGIQGDTTTVPIQVQSNDSGVGTITALTTTSSLLHTGTTSAPNLSIGGSAAQLNGQAASYYENRDTTAVGFSGGTITLTRAAGNLTVSLDGRYLPLTGGTLTGKLSINSTGAWNDAQALLTVGSGGDGRIQVRHIWGKSAANNNADHLWLNYQNANGHVQIGDSGGGNNLYVSGQIYAGGYFGGSLVLHAGNYTSYAPNINGGSTIAGITYFSNGESMQVYGIRGRFTNEYLHLYNKVGVGHPGGWGQGEGSTPDKGLSTYGGINVAYGNNATSSFAGQLNANGGLSLGGPLYYSLYTRRQISLAGPSTANFGNWKQFIRLWAASGSGANLFTLKVSVRGSWNWSAVFGTVEAYYSLYLAGDGTISGTKDFRITHVSGPATDNVRLGDAVIENGYVSIPVWCANSNTLEATVEQWNGSQILGSTTTAVSEALPAFIAPNFRGGLTSDGNAVLHAATTSAPNLSIGGNAATATNASQLGGNAAANFVQGAGSRGRSTSRSNGTASNLTDPSGFYYGATVTGMPTTDWWHWIQSIGNDWSAPDGYGYQLACSYWSDDLRLRRLTSGTWGSWVQLLHSGNYSGYALPITGGTLTGVLSIQASSDNQLFLQGTDTWAGIGFRDSANVADYIWYWGATQTFAIGGGGSSGVSGKKLHIDGGVTIGSSYDAVSMPTNGLNVEGAIQQAGNQVVHAGNVSSYAQTHRTNISSLLSSANIDQPVSTFDYSNPSGGPAATWINGWISTHANYLHSIIANAHRTSDWYVGYMEEGVTSPTWYKLLHSGNYSSYALPLSGGTLTGALSGTSASFSGALSSGGNSVLTVGNYSSYAVDNTKRVKQFFWDTISASTTQARRFEIARIAIDIVNWNQVGTFEIELSEQYWSNGLKKKYVVSYGYNSPRAVLKLVEMSGAGTNNFQVVLGSEQPVSGNHYYLPVYVDVRYYTYVDVRVTTSRQITANSTPPVGYTYINASPTPTNITDFGADSTVDISNAATAWQVGGNTIIHSGNYTSYPPARWATGRSISLTGDVTGTSGLFDGTANLSFAVTLANSGVTAGTYRSVTVDAKGRVTAGTNPTTLSGYGITDALPLTGGTLTGAINVSGVDQGLAIQHNGNTSAWFGRIITKNSTSDRAAFLGTYGTVAGVFAHNNALNAWADIYINTVDGSTGGVVRMPSTVYVNGNQVIHTGNYVSYSPSLTGGGASGTWGINISGSSASCSGNAATATNASQLNGQAGSYYENRSPTAVSISAGTLTITRAAGNLTTTIGGRVVAWCDFNGNFATTQTPNANFNVSSITKNATGDYTVNFSSALANANYVVAGTAQLDTPSPGQSNYNVMVAVPRRSGAKATGSCRIVCEYPAGVALYDSISVGVAFIAA